MVDSRVCTAELGDVYADGDGKLWRVTTVDQPVVHMEQVDTPASRLEGGISADTWSCFRRVYRPGRAPNL